jgi:3-oxoacyl-[acyl-carrier-protein] synthase II
MPEALRVAVTGIGAVSAIGTGKDAFWKALLAGTSGVSPIEAFPTTDTPVKIAGEVKGFEPGRWMDPAEVERYGRSSQLAIAASRLALEDGGEPHGPAGIYVGTTMGESRLQDKVMGVWTSQGREKIDGDDIRRGADNVLSVHVAKSLRLKADCLVFPTACAAGNYAIGHAFDQIRRRRVRWALAGGSDAFSRVALAGFGRMLALTPDRCRPFDKDRGGIVIGEGSAMLLLESMDDARARGAKIYAELLGYGMSCDANHMTIPHADGVEAAIRSALAASGVTPDQIDYVSAHGTGTRMNDKTECEALGRVFGTRKVPVSSIKSMLGHSMGAASAFESAACALALHHGEVPPTINFSTPDPECPIDCVPNQSRKLDLKVVLNDAFAFGGNNCCTVFAKGDRA